MTNHSVSSEADEEGYYCQELIYLEYIKSNFFSKTEKYLFLSTHPDFHFSTLDIALRYLAFYDERSCCLTHKAIGHDRDS